MKNKGLKVNSFNWTGSSGDYETGAMSGDGGYKSPIWDSSERFDTMSPEKSVVPMQEIYDYGEGMLSRVEEDWDEFWEDEGYMEPKVISLKLTAMLEDGDSILDVGMGDGRHSKFMSEKGFDVVGIDKSKVAHDMSSEDEGFVSIYGDIRHYNFGKKFDGFLALSVFDGIKDYSIAIDNIYGQLKPHAYGLIHIGSDPGSADDMVAFIKNVGFEVIKMSNIKIGERDVAEILVEKRDLDKIASVHIMSDCDENTCPVSGKCIKESSYKYPYTYNGIKYYTDSSDNLLKLAYNPEKYLSGRISFICDVANGYREKFDGLQVYSRLKSNAGLLFPYKRPTDVLYHMGKVRYPIDILFIGDDNRIKKIYKDIPPGSLGTFGSGNTLNVLEISGSLCDRLGIAIGNRVDIKIGDDSISPFVGSLSEYAGGKAIIKESARIESRVYAFGSHYILEKNMSDKSYGVANFIKTSSGVTADIALFDFRGLIDNGFDIKLFTDRGVVTANSKDVFGSSDMVGMAELFRSGPSGSYNGAIKSGFFTRNNHMIIKGFLKSARSKFRTAFILPDARNSLYVREFILNMVEDYSRSFVVPSNPDIIYASKEYTNDDILKIAKRKYIGADISIYSASKNIGKASSISVPDDVKSDAAEALGYFSGASDDLDKLYSALEKNLEEYSRISDDQPAISSSKGQYNESCKRNKKLIEDTLKKTLSGIKIMNKIKDISTTMDIVDSMATICKMSAESIQKVFDLVKQVESLDFISLLDERTSGALNLLDDYKESVRRMKNYINQDIIGILIISD